MTVTAHQIDAELALLGGDEPSLSDTPSAPTTVVPVPTVVGAPLHPKAMGAFEGADRFDQSLALWSPPLQSADANVLPDKEMLDGRTAQLTRDDALVKGAVRLDKDSLVGHVFQLNHRPASRILLGSEDVAWEQEHAAEVEEYFAADADNLDGPFDYTGRNTFSELIRLGVGVYFAGGEILAPFEWDRDPTRPFRTCIHLVDPVRLSTPFKYMMDEDVRAGVRRDRRGKPVSYYIKNRHPVEYRPTFSSFLGLEDWREVPATKPWGRPQIIHIYEQEAPDQTRGVAELTSALKETKFFHKLRDLTLQQIAAKSLYAAAITSDMPTEAVFSALGATGADGIAEAITNYGSAYLGAIGQYTSGARNLQIDGVRIPHLYPGTKLELLSPGKDSPIGSDFEMSVLRTLSVASGHSFEEFSHNYTGTNYSAIKAAIAKSEKHMKSKKTRVADRMANAIFRNWYEEMFVAGQFTTLRRGMDATWLYENPRRISALTRAAWLGSGRNQIDELKETQAAMLRIQAGLSTYEIECARLHGTDYRRIFKQAQLEHDLMPQSMRDRLAADKGAQNTANAASGTPKDKSNPKKNGAAIADLMAAPNEDTDESA